MSIDRVPVNQSGRVPFNAVNAYLLGEDDALLVDPAGHTPELTTAVTQRQVRHVAVTHTHPDHVGAIGDYAAATGATVWARAGRLDRFMRITGVVPDRTFHEGSRVGPATVLETPGHAVDHVAFVVGNEAVVGDLVLGVGSVVIGRNGGDMRAYLTSLRRLLAHNFDRLHPGHGPPIEDPNATLRWLLRHRRRRESAVLNAIRDGARTPDEIVDAAYDKDLSSVRDLAVETIVSHIEKLAVERRVVWDGQRVSPR